MRVPEAPRELGEFPGEALEAEVQRLGLADRVALTGAAGPEQIRSKLESTADLLCMPCVVAADGDRDSMPVVVKEALAMEIPVVATREVGLPEVVKPGWGSLAEPKDAPGLAEALEQMLGRPAEERARMGSAGREFVLEECNIVHETDKLVWLIGQTLDGRTPASNV